MSPDEIEQAIKALQAQVTSINQKVNAPPVQARRTSNVTNNTVGVIPNFLDAPVSVLALSMAAIAWTTFDASPYIPANAIAVILQSRYSGNVPDVAPFPELFIRADASQSGFDFGWLRASGDPGCGGRQGTYPVTTTLTFDYEVLIGFEDGVKVDLIGYWA